MLKFASGGIPTHCRSEHPCLLKLRGSNDAIQWMQSQDHYIATWWQHVAFAADFISCCCQVRAKLEALNADIKEQFRNLEESVR